MTALRLQKWLSQLGVASRREAQDLMVEGRITVNGKKATELGTKVDPDVDQICLDGKKLPKKRPTQVYWMLCKPDDVITSRGDPQNRKTIYDLPSIKSRKTLVFPVGRLDYHTEGLLLLSNDGELVQRLMHPKYKLPRHYYVMVNERLSPAAEAKIRKGITLTDGPTQPAELKPMKKPMVGNGFWYQITIYEGKKRIVRRIFKTMGQEVLRLIRFGFGDVRLPKDLAPGQIRSLYQEEILHLKSAAKLLD